MTGRRGESGGRPGFLLDRPGAREENGDMSFLRALGVTAIVTMTASLATACGDDGTGASGFSNGTESSVSGASSGSSGSSSSSSSSGGVAPTTTETTEGPTSGPGTMSGAESSTSTSAPGTTTTTGPSDTTTDEGTTSASGSSSTTSPAACGNGIIDGKEQCDGTDLNDFTCEALGNAGGVLQCDPVTCTFDTQLCDGGGGGTTG